MVTLQVLELKLAKSGLGVNLFIYHYRRKIIAIFNDSPNPPINGLEVEGHVGFPI